MTCATQSYRPGNKESMGTFTLLGRYSPLKMDSHIHNNTIHKYVYVHMHLVADTIHSRWTHIMATLYTQVHVHLVADTVHSRWTLTSTTTPYTSTCILRGRYGPLEMDSHIHDNNTIHKYMYTSWQIRSIRDGLSHP